MAKKQFKYAYVAKFGKNIGTDDDPKWINHRLGAGFTEGEVPPEPIKVKLTLIPAWAKDGTITFTLWPVDDDDDKPRAKARAKPRGKRRR